MVWSLVTMLLVLSFGPGFADLLAVLRDRRQVALLAVAAALVTANWGVYVYGVNVGRVVETSLGYFVNPLLTIVLGVVFLRERLRPTQWAAVGIGAAAVAVIAVDYGRPPWIALVLALSFGLYGYCKKRTTAPPLVSLTVETGVQFLPALVALAVLQAQGSLVFGHRASTSVLLAGAGVVTVAPLLLFAASARRLPLTVLGLLQYLTPVLQFAVGVGIRHEHLPATEFVGFCLVWLALIVLGADAVRHGRSARRPPAEPADVATAT